MRTLKTLLSKSVLGLCFAMLINLAQAAADIEVNTPEIAAIKSSMQARHQELSHFYQSGAIGLTQDGKVDVKDLKAAALKDRAKVSSLVSAENADRMKLYAAIAKANGHPEWQADIQNTFALRWINKAKTGWYYQQAGQWVQK